MNIIKQIKLLLIAMAAAAHLCSCSSLSKSQLESVAKFADGCDSFTAYPSLLFHEINNIRRESAFWYSASLNSPERRVEEIVALSAHHSAGIKMAKGTDLSMEILSKYSRALKSLAHKNRVESPGVDVRRAGRAIDSLIIAFNSLQIVSPVSTGLASSIAKIVAFGAELNASRVRAEALRVLIPEGDSIVNQLCRSLETILKEEETKSLILHEQKMVVSNYLSFVRITGSNIEEDRKFAELIERADRLTRVRTSTINSVGALRRAHNKLAANIENGIPLPELFEEIGEFRSEVEKLYKIFKKL